MAKRLVRAHIYQDGLRHEGHVLGHWGGDWRALDDGVGARSVFARVGWQPRVGGTIEASYRQLDNEDYSARQLRDGVGRSTSRYSRPWQRFLRRRRAHVRRATCSATPTRGSAPSSASRSSHRMKTATPDRARRGRRLSVRAVALQRDCMRRFRRHRHQRDARRSRHRRRCQTRRRATRAACMLGAGLRRELSGEAASARARTRRRRWRPAARRARARLPAAIVGAVRRDGIRRRRAARPRDSRLRLLPRRRRAAQGALAELESRARRCASATRSRATTCCRPIRKAKAVETTTSTISQASAFT